MKILVIALLAGFITLHPQTDNVQAARGVYTNEYAVIPNGSTYGEVTMDYNFLYEKKTFKGTAVVAYNTSSGRDVANFDFNADEKVNGLNKRDLRPFYLLWRNGKVHAFTNNDQQKGLVSLKSWNEAIPDMNSDRYTSILPLSLGKVFAVYDEGNDLYIRLKVNKITTNTPKVTKVVVEYDKSKANQCGDFGVLAKITATGPIQVAYQWERSDAAIPPVENIVFEKAGTKIVYATWALAASGNEWLALHIISPNSVTSDYIPIISRCE